MAEKQHPRWMDVVGVRVRDLLIAHQGRQFNFHRSGPYTQSKELAIGIFFNENEPDELHSRFGYELNSYLSKPGNDDSRVLSAGFHIFVAGVAVNRFRPNLQANLKTVADLIGAWLQRQERSRFTFAKQGDEKFEWEPRIAVRHLSSELALYGDLERKSSGVLKDQPGLVSGTSFRVSSYLNDFNQMSPERIESEAPEIAEAAVAVFDELSFLYDLLLLPGEKVKIRPSVTPPPPIKPVDPPGPITPDPPEDERPPVFANVVVRQGQGGFRNALLKAYNGQCAVSGYSVDAVLQAAHIKPYSGEKSNHVTNGLLLRADIHNLFDLGLLSIDPKTNKIEVAPSVRGSDYGKFNGLRLRLPNDNAKRPDSKALEHHYNQRKTK